MLSSCQGDAPECRVGKEASFLMAHQEMERAEELVKVAGVPERPGGAGEQPPCITGETWHGQLADPKQPQATPSPSAACRTEVTPPA
jgi:hypothetical protein